MRAPASRSRRGHHHRQPRPDARLHVALESRDATPPARRTRAPAPAGRARAGGCSRRRALGGQVERRHDLLAVHAHVEAPAQLARGARSAIAEPRPAPGLARVRARAGCAARAARPWPMPRGAQLRASALRARPRCDEVPERLGEAAAVGDHARGRPRGGAGRADGARAPATPPAKRARSTRARAPPLAAPRAARGRRARRTSRSSWTSAASTRSPDRAPSPALRRAERGDGSAQLVLGEDGAARADAGRGRASDPRRAPDQQPRRAARAARENTVARCIEGEDRSACEAHGASVSR